MADSEMAGKDKPDKRAQMDVFGSLDAETPKIAEDTHRHAHWHSPRLQSTPQLQLTSTNWQPWVLTMRIGRAQTHTHSRLKIFKRDIKFYNTYGNFTTIVLGPRGNPCRSSPRPRLRRPRFRCHSSILRCVRRTVRNPSRCKRGNDSSAVPL